MKGLGTSTLGSYSQVEPRDPSTHRRGEQLEHLTFRS